MLQSARLLGLLRKILPLVFVTRRDRVLGALLVFSMFVGACFEAVGIGVIIPFVAILSRPDALDGSGALRLLSRVTGAASHREMILVTGGALVAVFLFKNAFVGAVQHFQYRFIFARQARLATALTEKFMRRTYAFHVVHNSSELVHSVSHEVSIVFHHVVVQFFVVAVELLALSVIAALVVAMEPVVLPVVGVVLVGVSFVFYRAVHRRAIVIGAETRRVQTEMLKWLQQALGGVKEAAVLGCEGYFIRAFADRSVRHGELLVAQHTALSVPRYLLETTGILGLVAVSVGLYLRGGESTAVLPVLGALAVGMVRALPSVARIIGSLADIRFCGASVDAVHSMMRAADSDRGAGSAPRLAPLPFEREFRVRHATFRHAGAARQTLRDVSLDIRRGESIAIVGASGAGKTTLVDVALGLLDLESGWLEVDGERLSGERLARWQRAIGYIPQGIYLCDDTLRRNIAFGVPDDEIDEERVERAVEAASLKDFVDAQPERLDALVGERGARLSGGQRQRIGIARALYRDPQILVLDEATSALDSGTEREVVEAIARVCSDRTAIIIAHRLSTVRRCDRLVMMADGRVEDVGTWQELLVRNAEFRRMVQLAGTDADEGVLAS